MSTQYQVVQVSTHEVLTGMHISLLLYNRLIEKPGSSYGDVNILGVTTLYVIIFFSSSALSLYLSGYLYCVCLFYIVVNNDILQRALQSITKNGRYVDFVY